MLMMVLQNNGICLKFLTVSPHENIKSYTVQILYYSADNKNEHHRNYIAYIVFFLASH
jgi:hypothetical protein